MPTPPPLPSASASSCPEAASGETNGRTPWNQSFSGVDSVELRIVEPREIDSNTVEIDGVRFEIVMPERVLRIPENKPDASTKVELGIRVTNKTPTPLRFTGFDNLALSIVKPNGQPLNGSREIVWKSAPRESEVPLIQPGEDVTFFLDAELFWEQNKLRLGGSGGPSGRWYFESLEPETYLFGVSYFRPKRLTAFSEESPLPGLLDDFWRGSGATPFVEVRLVRP